MKVAIVGTRNPKISFEEFTKMMNEANDFETEEIVSGGAKGIDTYAERYAKLLHNSCTIFKPNYSKFGRNATLVRNTEIAEYADFMVAFPSENSRGSYDSIRKMKKLNKPVKIIKI